ncbi:MAG: prephenate dehydratase [Candidatus Doudnabacteria bacterium]|nr:prephenate dehydratase [Candidatus Doudnabacteria bacterium]
MTTVSIQGYKGSFHDVVASELFTEKQLLERSTFKEVFDDVKEGRAEFGVTAIENSIAGAILQNYDLLRDSGLQVVGEYYLRIVHNLMALPGVKIEDIKEVWSHPMALKQCQDFLLKYPHIKQVETDDTARSALQIKELSQKTSSAAPQPQQAVNSDPRTVAAIASSLAAETYGMEIIAAGIEDDPQNYTRFLLIQRQNSGSEVGLKSQKIDKKLEDLIIKLDQTPDDHKCKVSTYVETAHRPGGLLPVLQAIKDHEANMTMLVSRPVVGKAWEYGFYIDFVIEESKADELLEILTYITDECKLLGKYANFHPLKQISG